MTNQDAARPIPFHPYLVWRGLLGAIFGLVMVFWPRQQLAPTLLALSTDVVDWLLLAYLGLAAVLLVLQARSRRLPAGTSFIVWGQAIVALPALAFLLIAEQAGQLVAAISVWALLYGGLEIWLWRMLRARYRGASDFLIVGVLHALLALILFISPGMQPLAILGFTGAAALMSGIVLILGGITARRALRTAGADADETVSREQDDASS